MSKLVNAQGNQPGIEDDDAEANVTHFIPSVQLKGRREDKIQTLDLLIHHLESLRRALIDRSPVAPEWRAQPPMQLSRSDRWWAGGLLVAAALVLVMLGARACTLANDDSLHAGRQTAVARLVLDRP